MHAPERGLTPVVLVAAMLAVAPAIALAGPPELNSSPAPQLSSPNGTIAPGTSLPTTSLPSRPGGSASDVRPMANVPADRRRLVTTVPLAPHAATSSTPSPNDLKVLRDAGLTTTSSGSRAVLEREYAKTIPPRRPFVTLSQQPMPYRRFVKSPSGTSETNALFASTQPLQVRFGTRVSPGIAAGLGTAPITINTATSAPIPAPQITNVFVDGNGSTTEIATNRTILISGNNFGASPIAKLDFGRCGSLTLPLTQQTDTKLVATIPFVPVNAMKMPAKLTVSVQGGGDSNSVGLTYLADLDVFIAEVDVGIDSQPGGDFVYANGSVQRLAGGGHVTASNVPLVEQVTMDTSNGPDGRYSHYPGWQGGQGGAGVDEFFRNVSILNDWHLVDLAITQLDCNGSFGLNGCDARFIQSPLPPGRGLATYGSSGPYDATSTTGMMVTPGGGVTDAHTKISFSFDPDRRVSYNVVWAFIGPHGKRLASIYPAPLNL
ncbi:MAG: IPT/TIG domain-containing protein, partial [Candidatus Eremiobacteraeota bacterium]|nr:IPT/TIG domain-containing protein [Candidatus Eremiobacteraeota bacterium]